MTDKKMVVTDPVRIAFPALFTPKPKSPSTPNILTYQAVLLLPPDTDLDPFKAAIMAAVEEKWGKKPKGKWNSPLKDAGEKDHLDGYEAGWHYINVQSKRKPGVVDRNAAPIGDEDMIYGGAWVQAYINAFPWHHAQSGYGVSFGLLGVQFVKDDTRFGGGTADVGSAFKPLGDLDDEDTDDDANDLI